MRRNVSALIAVDTTKTSNKSGDFVGKHQRSPLESRVFHSERLKSDPCIFSPKAPTTSLGSALKRYTEKHSHRLSQSPVPAPQSPQKSQKVLSIPDQSSSQPRITSSLHSPNPSNQHLQPQSPNPKQAEYKAMFDSLRSQLNQGSRQCVKAVRIEKMGANGGGLDQRERVGSGMEGKLKLSIDIRPPTKEPPPPSRKAAYDLFCSIRQNSSPSIKKTPLSFSTVLPDAISSQDTSSQPPQTLSSPQLRWTSSRADWPPTNLTLSTPLGTGSFSTVYSAYDNQLNCPVAVKVITKPSLPSPHLKAAVQGELSALTDILHPNICKMLRWTEDKSSVYIVMAVVSGVTLKQYSGKLRSTMAVLPLAVREERARKIFVQIVSAVSYIHRLGYVHRDLKLSNVMFDPTTWHATLIDFGFAAKENEYNKKICCGTPAYISPEVLSNASDYSGKKTDVWALGVILYILLTGYYPFGTEEDPTLQKKILKAEFDIPQKFSQELKEVLQACFKLRWQDRPSAEELMNFSWMAVKPPS